MKPLLWRLRHSPWFIAAAVLLLTSGAIVGGTYASFTADTQQNTSTFAGGWIEAATINQSPGTSVVPSGYDASLSWTPGTHGPVTGQQLYYLDNGSSSTCATSGYTLASNSLTSGSSSATASNPVSTTLTANMEAPNLLNANINASTNPIAVKNNASFAFTSNFVIQIDSEQMLVTAEAGGGNKNWTVTRGYNGTTAVSHSGNTPVYQISAGVANASGFPQSGSFTIGVDSEQMTVNSGQGTGAQTFLVTRAANSTTGASHTSGALVTQVPDPVDGHYYCYQMVSTSATNWTATASFPATQLGLVAQSVTLANGGSSTSGKLETGDTITIVFNQAPTGIATGTANKDVCVFDTVSPAVIILGDSANCANSTDANDGGVISGMTLTGGGMGGANGKMNCNTSTVALSGSTLTITLGGAGNCAAGNGTPVSDSGSGTYTPASSILTAATTDQAPVCTSATYNCLPTTTGTP